MRPRKDRLVRNSPLSRFYKPRGVPMSKLGVVTLRDEEWEAILLADHQGLDQERAAELMGVSRPTFSRVLTSARKAVARALVDGCALEIGGGDFRKVSALPTHLETDMKIAFATPGNDLSAPVDDRFGRAPQFLIYDPASKAFEIVANTALDDGHGAGIKAAEIIVRAGAKALVAGECGPKASDMLAKAGVTFHSVKSLSIREALVQQFGEAE